MYILDFAKDGNADETYAKIRDWQDRLSPREVEDDELVLIANEYEAGNLEDLDFCNTVVEHFNTILKKYGKS